MTGPERTRPAAGLPGVSFRRLILLAASACLVHGCSQPVTGSAAPGASGARAAASLSAAAERASAAFADLARSEQARTEQARTDRVRGGHARTEQSHTAAAAAPDARRAPSFRQVPHTVPPELARQIELDWIGPIAGIASYLAARTGYGFREIGARPVQPVMIELTDRRARVIDLFEDAGWQAGSRALLEVDAVRRRVRLSYPHPEHAR